MQILKKILRRVLSRKNPKSQRKSLRLLKNNHIKILFLNYYINLKGMEDIMNRNNKILKILKINKVEENALYFDKCNLFRNFNNYFLFNFDNKINHIDHFFGYILFIFV
jgi:hypothetical protein